MSNTRTETEAYDFGSSLVLLGFGLVLDNKQIIYSRDVKFFKDIFPFKQNNSSGIDNSVQDVNHLNFFNTNTLDDLPKIPNDEERRNPSPIRHVNSPSHSSSTSAFLNENDAGHSQDADVFASENASFAADEENNSNYKGNDLHDQSQDNVSQDNVSQDNNGTQNLRRKYCLELIDEFGLLAGKPSNLPMQPNISLTSEPSDIDPLLDNVTEYQKLSGKLIYLTTTRPDITYTVSCLSQLMHNPLKSHLKTALKVIKYLKGSPGKGINVIEGSASSIDLKAYSDADWARCADTRSKDRPSMLAPGNYVQWKSRIRRYIDTKPNHEFIHYCLKNPPYELDNDIYSTVDACPNACEMWKAIERLKQGESINVQDLETNLYWEFRKFTSQDGESLESYYSRFYKIMNELIRNQCKVTNH
nr:ribonuclease H-like domain-containing protein [Tanacetum cinerariifolium]